MNIKRILLLCLLSCLLLCGCTSRGGTPAATPEPTAAPTPEPTPEPVPFSAVAERSAVTPVTFAGEDALWSYCSKLPACAPEPAGEAFFPICAPAESSDAVTGEGDIRYILSDGQLRIVRMEGDAAQVLSTVTASMAWETVPSEDGLSWQGGEKSPFAVYASDGYAAVISDRFGYTAGETEFAYREYTSVDIYDCSDPAAPVLTASLGQSGGFVSASLSNGTLIVLTEYDPKGADAEAGQMPSTYDYDAETAVPVSKVIGAAACESAGMTVAGAYDLSSGAMDVRVMAGFDGCGTVAGNALLLAQSRQGSTDSRTYMLDGAEYHETAYAAVTDVYALPVSGGSFSDVTVRTIPGTLYAGKAVSAEGDGWLCLVRRDNRLEAESEGIDAVENAADRGLSLVRLDSNFALRGETVLSDGAEEITWAALGEGAVFYSAGNALYAAGTEPAETAAPKQLCSAGAEDGIALTCGKDGYLLITEQNGKKTLRLTDKALAVSGELALGDDYSRILRQWRGIMTDAERHWIGLPADDSYCLYSADGNGLTFVQNFFFRDWMWEVSARMIGDTLVLTDTNEILIRDADDLELGSEIVF